MRNWTYGGNGYKKFLYGGVTLIESPLWLWLVEWWADHGCSFIPPIPFPNWPKMHLDKDDPTNVVTPKEWYGDLRQLYCSRVCNPLIGWIYRHPKRKTYHVEIGWEKLKEIMYKQHPKWFDDMEEVNKE